MVIFLPHVNTDDVQRQPQDGAWNSCLYFDICLREEWANEVMNISNEKVVLTEWKLKVMYSMLLFWESRHPVLVLHFVWVYCSIVDMLYNDDAENSLWPRRNMKILKTSHLIEMKSHFSHFVISKLMSESFLLSCCWYVSVVMAVLVEAN